MFRFIPLLWTLFNPLPRAAAEIPASAYFGGPQFEQTDRTRPVPQQSGGSRTPVTPVTGQGQPVKAPNENISYLTPVTTSTGGYTHLWGNETDDRLLSYLGHETPELRAEAARELGRRQYVPAVPALIIRLTDSSTLVSSEAACALAGYTDSTVTAQLLDELDSPDENTVKAALNALGLRKDPAATERISAMLRKGPARYRAAAAQALGTLGDPRAGEGLLYIVETPSDNTPELVTACLQSLGKIYYPRAASALIKLAQENDGAFRDTAFNTLCAMRNRAAWPVFISRLGTDERARAMECIMNMRDSDYANRLKTLLKSKNAAEATAAAELLAKINTTEIREYLETLDDDIYTQQAIAAAYKAAKTMSAPAPEDR